ncbi:S8 family serine peptidase [Pseudarthrobacter sp. R1]|nr:S8 family serine peptidase [Pseudarthrobacter sp. R1]MCQ6269131.1 S8 family serine peptidase [Pseudarthrobacter sp. R1]
MKKIVMAGFAAAMLAFGTINPAVVGNAAPDPSHVTGQIMVKFRDNRAAAGVLRQHGLTDGPDIGDTGAHLIKVPEGKELRLIEALSRNPVVEHAEPDNVVTAATDDTFFGSQYALQNTGQEFFNNYGTISTDPVDPPKITVAKGASDADVDAVEAWTTTTGGGTKVAVLHSGVDLDHPDINPQVVARANFTASKTNEDKYGHGTHVAGIVAANADNGIGVAGVCPGCTILAGKVLTDTGLGSTSALANGINWAVNNGAKVINMSLAVRASRTLETAVNNAWNRGVVLVAAAGNGNNQTKIYPAAYTNVIAVGATDNNDAKASFSTYGPSWVDIAAPGVAVFSTFPNQDFALREPNKRSLSYDIGNGTSMAAPIVAAVAALAWSSRAAPTADTVRANVLSSGEKKTEMSAFWAYGRVNACKAVSPSC